MALAEPSWTEVGDRGEADSCTCWESGPETLARGWGRARARVGGVACAGWAGLGQGGGRGCGTSGTGPEEVGGSG